MAIKLEKTDSLPLKPKRSRHSKILQKNLDYICSNSTNLSKLTLLLVTFDVMQIELREQIGYLVTISEQLDHNMAPGQDSLEQYCSVYTHIAKREDAAFRHLLSALKKSGNVHIYNHLYPIYEAEVHNIETPDDFPDYHKSFSEKPPRRFRDIRKRDILRFCFWGFGTVSLVIISIVLLVRHFQGATTSIAFSSSSNTTKHYKVTTVASGDNNAFPQPPTGSPLIPPINQTAKPEVTIEPITQGNSFVSIQINSPSSPIPAITDPNSKLNLTILTTKKYDWRTLSLANRYQVHSLALKGSFNESDTLFFLQYFENLRRLSISHGSYLCEEFKGKIDEEEITLEIHKNIDTIRISVVPECELMYKYLGNSVNFPNIRTVIFERVFISVSNFAFIHEFFSNHRNHITRLFFLNVTLCDTCEIFKGIIFSNLEEAKFIFFDGTTSSAAKTVRNFSEATPFMSRFYSNIACSSVEPKILGYNWKHIRSSIYDFCEE